MNPNTAPAYPQYVLKISISRKTRTALKVEGNKHMRGLEERKKVILAHRLFMYAMCFLQWSNGAKRKVKTYNSRDSLMVTHLTTNPPVSCLNRAERTGSLVFMILWSYVDIKRLECVYLQR
jgi:hypothetical protein